LCWNRLTPSGQWVASGREITLADAKGFLDSPNGEHLKRQHWRPWKVGSHYDLIAPVRRLSPVRVELYGREYHLKRVALHDDGKVNRTSSVITCHEELVGETEVRNVNHRAAIFHFIDNEGDIPKLMSPGEVAVDVYNILSECTHLTASDLGDAFHVFGAVLAQPQNAKVAVLSERRPVSRILSKLDPSHPIWTHVRILPL
jgi:hypothetical protein